ncbi:MAG: Gfo/Idh/MocA family oxidoreductase [Rhodospirillales bacterium]|nr:MAG: Gfo/Idh/MocA family oxidoreductase [Rhodospirillales bacterium]
MIDAAIVGLGWWGRHLVETAQTSSRRIRFVRAVDSAPEPVREFAGRHGLHLSADYTDALTDPQVQAVILTTPHACHAEQAIQAAEAGKHVFVEKPLALTGADAAHIVASCERAGVVLGVGHERRFEPALREIKAMIADGELGTLMHAEAHFSHDTLAALDPSNWRLSPMHAPAAGMTAMGVHLTDTLIDLMGPVAHLYAETAKQVLSSPGGDVVSVLLKFQNGATAFVSAILKTPFFMRLHVFGSDAWIEARDRVRPEAEGLVDVIRCRAGGSPEAREVASIDAALANLEAFAMAAAGKATYPIPVRDMVHNVAVLDAIRRSVELGQPVEVASG